MISKLKKWYRRVFLREVEFPLNDILDQSESGKILVGKGADIKVIEND